MRLLTILTDQLFQPLIREPGFWNTVLSVLAAAFGVQSRKNQHRDFSQGRLSYFIIAGLMFTALFIILVLSVAKIAKDQVQSSTQPPPIASPKSSPSAN